MLLKVYYSYIFPKSCHSKVHDSQKLRDCEQGNFLSDLSFSTKRLCELLLNQKGMILKISSDTALIFWSSSYLSQLGDTFSLKMSYDPRYVPIVQQQPVAAKKLKVYRGSTGMQALLCEAMDYVNFCIESTFTVKCVNGNG